ncbi:ABC transporter permease [Fulvivirgaceae bacterium BMA10]|uniref:ABC transporter permease n=1 Tax=Splendidivirga corallicola TaxID=3051826 RepID=A0ABT8KYQ0_9BACT|nr:ABC transporter permease [Fulvivirgaceae bacterium BMA10]
MFKNYIKVGIRNILKQKFYAAINILGLSIGIAAAMFIVFYVADELTYDQFHQKIDRMHRVGLHGKLGGQEVYVTSTCPPLAHTMMDEIPEVEATCRLWEWDNVVMKYEDLAFTEEDILLTDSNFFDFYSFRLLEGNPKTALKEPRSIVMTSSVARKYFGDETGLGKLITVGNDGDTYTVTGIVQDPPGNSHFKFNFLFSMSSSDFGSSEQWLSNSLHTYFIVREGSEMNNVQTKLDDMVVKYVGPEIQQFMGISLQKFLDQDGAYGYLIDRVEDIHLNSRLEGELEPPGDIANVYLFIAIGLFILLIASINFMNLSTARSAGRTREVGMRKTFGSFRSQLIGQFLIESIIYSIIALVLALIIVGTLMPQFNLLSGKELELNILLNTWMILGTLGLTILVGVLAGSYPAFYLTHFKVTEILKGKVARGMKGGGIRGILVVLQFGMSIFLIIFTIIVYRQLQYTQNKNLGFDKEQVLVVYNASRLENNRDAFKNELSNQNMITDVSYSNSVIPGVNNTTVFRKAGAEEDHIIGVYFGDYEHVNTMGFQLLDGRNFSRDFPTDSSAILINEATVKELGWTNPINEELISFNGDEPEKLKVIGVLKDFNFESLRNTVRPLIIRLGTRGNLITVKLNTGEVKEAVNLIETKWKEFAANEPFEYEFMDQNFDEMYRTEQRMGKLFAVFTVIAIFVACLGLFGLAAYTAEQRTREIGVRKALGASGFNIVTLLSKEFMKFVAISFILAVGPAWYFIDKWLEGFVYRVSIGAGIFIISGLLALIIALLTVSYQSIKASRVNPASTLKYE